jgi:DNA-binding transcriptional LysR family regulator
MDFHQLEAFYTIAREKSFSRAAEVLHLSQSAISTRMTNLESQIGVNLFTRNGRIIELSKYGEAFEPYVHQILLLAKDASNRLEQIKHNESARLAIGTTSRIATYLLPNLLKRFQSEMPDMQIHIETVFAEQIMEMLENGKIHIALVSSPSDDERFVKIPLIKDRMILVGSPDHPVYTRFKTEGRFVFKWLEGTAFINFRNESKYYRSFIDLLQKNNILAKQVITVNNLEVMKRMAAQQVGFAFLSRMAVSDELQKGNLVEIPIGHSNLFAMETYLMYQQQRFIHPAVSTFISIAEKNLKQEIDDFFMPS